MKCVTIIIAGTLAIAAAASPGDEVRRARPGTKEAYTVSEKQMVWGEITNLQWGDWVGRQFDSAIRIGIRAKDHVIVLAGNPVKAAHKASVYGENRTGVPVWMPQTGKADSVPTHNINPTNLLLVFLPPDNERCAVRMVDAEGKSVAKTSEGEKLGQWPSLTRSARFFHWNEYGCQRLIFYPYSDDEIYSIDPSRYLTSGSQGYIRSR